jgi:DNA polymerase-3 subunit delta
MAKEMDSLAVRKGIDAGRIPPVWLWSGPEDYLKEELFRHLAARVIQEGTATFNLNRYRAGQDDVKVALGTCRTLPMMGDRRLVLIADVEKTPRGDREDLLAYVARPAQETVLILNGERPPGDSLNRSLVAAGATGAVFWVPFENQTRQWVRIKFKDLGKRCDGPTAQALLERCGGGEGARVPLGEIAPEIEKVALAVGDREVVSPGDLDVIARKADEDLLKEVLNRVGRKDAEGALRALDGALLFRANPEIRIVASLTHRMINIAKVAEAGPGKSGVWGGELEEVTRASRNFDRNGIQRALEALALADRTLKSRPKAPRIVLEETIINICSL